MQKKDLISYRDKELSDTEFIYSTWLRGLRYGNTWFEAIEPDIYYKNYHLILDKILKDSQTNIKVACLIEDPSVILGFSVFKHTTLHWVFVRKIWRKIGIAKDLIPKDITTITHMTKIAFSIKPSSIIFNPFIL